jgi:hypothetical protein
VKKTSLIVLFIAFSVGLSAETANHVTGAPRLEARTVAYRFGVATPVYTQQRWGTIIYLNKSEKIVNVVMADADNFELHIEKNINYVTVNSKADSTPGARTNLSLMATSGNLYTVAIYDVTGNPEGHADTQVTLDSTGDREMNAAQHEPPKYVSAEKLAEVDAELKHARAAVEDSNREKEEYRQKMEKKAADDAEAAKASAIKEVRSGYKFTKATAEPFKVYSMTDDGKFTMIKTHANEQFAIYELKEGKPIAINIFPDGTGSIRCDRIVDNGYFQVGKKKAYFSREKD